MEFTNNDDVIIILNIKDRRGRNIRVSGIHDIHIKVWTHNPDCALPFEYKDIKQKRTHDELIIKGGLMEALPSGVISYQYDYKIEGNEPVIGEIEDDEEDDYGNAYYGHKHGHKHDHRNIIKEIIITDIFWKNRFKENIIFSPVYFHTLELTRQLINKEAIDRNKQIANIEHYVTVEYTNKLDAEVERATEKENEIVDNLNDVAELLNNTIENLEAEVEKTNRLEIDILKRIDDVIDELHADKDELINSISDLDTKTTDNLNVEIDRAKAEEKRIDEKLDDEIARADAKEKQLALDISLEVTRAKSEETRIENKVDLFKTNLDTEITRSTQRDADIEAKQTELKNNIETLTTNLNSEITRSTLKDNEHDTEIEKIKLVDKDITESLQALKQTVLSKNTEFGDAIVELNGNVSDLNTELARVEGKVDNNTTLVNDESKRAKLVEKDITESLQSLKQTIQTKNGEFADAISDINNDLSGIHTSIGAANQLIESNTDLITDESNRAKLVEKDITESLQNLKQNVLNKNTEVADSLVEIGGDITSLNTELVRVEGKVDNNTSLINDEVKRAKLVEKDMSESFQTLKQLVESKKSEMSDTVVALNGSVNALNTDIARVEGKVDNNNTLITEESNRAKLAESDTNKTLQALKQAVETKNTEFADSFVTVNGNIASLNTEIARVEGKVDNNTSLISDEADRAKDVEKEISDSLQSLKQTVQTKNTEFANEFVAVKGSVSNLTTQLGIVDGKVDNNTSMITGETNRAKLVEKDITESLQNLKQSVLDKNTEVDDSIKEVKDGISNVEKLVAILNGDENKVGSVLHTVVDMEHEIDDKLVALKSEIKSEIDFTPYATKDYVSDKFSELIGTAPEALDTLGEIADKLHMDDDALKAINSVLTQKAQKDDVYNKTQIDTKVSELENLVNTEKQRATLAESALKSAIDIINGDEDVIGSIKHCLEDAKHYTDDQLLEVGSVNTKLVILESRIKTIEDMLTWYVHTV